MPKNIYRAVLKTDSLICFRDTTFALPYVLFKYINLRGALVWQNFLVSDLARGMQERMGREALYLCVSVLGAMTIY